MISSANIVDFSTDINKTVHVSHLPPNITEEQLLELFSPCGPIQYIRVMGDDTQAQRFAFVEFMEIGGFQAAFNLAGFPLCGNLLQVNRSHNGCAKPYVKAPPDLAARLKATLSLIAQKVDIEEEKDRKTLGHKTRSHKRSKSRSRSRSRSRRKHKSRDRRRSKSRDRSKNRHSRRMSDSPPLLPSKTATSTIPLETPLPGQPPSLDLPPPLPPWDDDEEVQADTQQQKTVSSSSSNSQINNKQNSTSSSSKHDDQRSDDRKKNNNSDRKRERSHSSSPISSRKSRRRSRSRSESRGRRRPASRRKSRSGSRGHRRHYRSRSR